MCWCEASWGQLRGVGDKQVQISVGRGRAALSCCRFCLAMRPHLVSDPKTGSPLPPWGLQSEELCARCSWSFWNLHPLGEQKEQEGLHFPLHGAFNHVVLSDTISKNNSWFLVPDQPSAVTFLIPVLNKNRIVNFLYVRAVGICDGLGSFPPFLVLSWLLPKYWCHINWNCIISGESWVSNACWRVRDEMICSYRSLGSFSFNVGQRGYGGYHKLSWF